MLYEDTQMADNNQESVTDLVLKTKLNLLVKSEGYIKLDDPISPAVLAGLLGISEPMVYQGQQNGKLPSRKTASYRECIQHYVDFYKKKMVSKSSNMMEAKIAQDVRNGIAKEEMQWLEIKKTKEQLVDVAEMKDLFEPIFHVMKSTLVNLSRKYPEIRKDLDNTMESLFTLGDAIERKAKQDSQFFVESMLSKDLTLTEAYKMVEDTYEDLDISTSVAYE